MKKFTLAAILFASASVVQASDSNEASQGNAASGEQKAAACVACHGPAGVSTIPANPTLAGQHKTYLVHALHAYKNGQRSNPIMKGMAAGLSDQDIEDLAEYFSSQEGLKF